MYIPLWVVIFSILVGVAAIVTIIASIVWKHKEIQRKPLSSQALPHISTQEINSSTDNYKAALPSTLDGPQGLGGWLIWFQIRIWLGVANTLFSAGSIPSAEAASPKRLLVFAAVVLLVVCLVFFYQRKLKFRILYIIADALSLLYMILIYGRESYLLVGVLLFEGIIIYALFRSRRVANTFH